MNIDIRELKDYLREIRVYEYNSNIVTGIVKKQLTHEQWSNLVGLFYDSYDSTAQDTNIFGKEFFNVVGFLNYGQIPIKLEFLEVDEMFEDILSILKNE